MIKRYLLVAALTVATATAAFSQPYDKNHAWHNKTGNVLYASSMIYPHAFDTEYWTKRFADLGLWFSVGPEPPHNIWVNYMTDPQGDKQLKETGQWRPFVCVGKLGSKLPIYCVNGATERDDTLLIDAFVAGYELRTKTTPDAPDSGNAAANQ
jgi:hypothetical protein